MNLFKITYINNKPISCRLVTGKIIRGKYTYEFINRSLIYALINANNEDEALNIAEDIVAKFQQIERLLDGQHVA